MTGLRTAAEIGVGLLFVTGAIFNTVYTLAHSREFYGSFADGAWFAPARWFINDVVLPNATVFTIILILFQVGVATMILLRGELLVPALMTGATFSILSALASNPGGTVGNLALAAIQIALAVTH